MLETHEWDDVLGRLVGVQFRGTERIASSTILDALGVAQDKEARQLARTHTHLEKKSRTVMSRSCVISFPFDRRFRDSPSQGDNNIRVHATKRLWIATFKTRTGMLSNVAPISGRETAESSRRNGRKPEGNPRRKPPPCSAQGLSPQPGIQRSRHPTRRGRPLGCR